MKNKVIYLSVFFAFFIRAFSLETDEAKATNFLQSLDESYTNECNLEMIARWDYIVDVKNDTAQELADAADIRYFTFQSESAKNVSNFDYTNFKDVNLYRQFRFQADQGPGGLNETNLAEYKTLQSRMETTYSTATVCKYKSWICNKKNQLPLDPDITNIMATSTDWKALQHYWEQWRDVTGKKMKDDYKNFVVLSNKAATLDGYSNTGEYWLNGYTVTPKEVEGFSDKQNLTAINQAEFKLLVRDIWQNVSESLYKPLHAYVRMKLGELYKNKIDLKKPIPAHILGNMWAQDWTNIGKHVMPFPEEPDFDVTNKMKKNGWDINKMFKTAEEFFVSLGLPEMTDDFWEKSVIDQTKWGKKMVCHASAEDFCLGENSTDFRIKMCTQVNMGDLVTVHHEMGHIEYFMAYRNQPHVYRTSANPGFHEAIGDTIALSVMTPKHMASLNLTNDESHKKKKSTQKDAKVYTDDEKKDLNYLMKMALQKIAFLPFGYILDKYRWGIFDGTIKPDFMNSAWWDMREKYQGVMPPSGIYRDDTLFDAGSKYHVPSNVPYMRYFVSYIAQFQFQKKLCETAEFDGPLHLCDIQGNEDAGLVLSQALEKGLSEPWPLILEELGGSLELDAEAINEYFQPLMDYLNTQLKGQMIGWNIPTDPKFNNDTSIQLSAMDKNMSTVDVASIEGEWDYEVNVTDDTTEAMNEADLDSSNLYRFWWETFLSTYNFYRVTDPKLRRQFEMQQNIDTDILDNEENKKLNDHMTAMSKAYGSKVCPITNANCDLNKDGYDIDRLELEMKTNKKYSDLLYYWEYWRDASGKKMIDDFKASVELQNEAAIANKFQDATDMWLEPYTTYGSDDYTQLDFKTDVQDLFESVFPYYEKLHAYVRYRLRQTDNYKKYMTNEDDLIPAHILGNMWAQEWQSTYDMVAPYPKIDLINIDQELKNQTVTWMFETAEDFYKSLGMFNMTEDFWENSMMVQPKNREVICPAEAIDFFSTEVDNKKDGRFRISMCTKPNQDDFITIHHEMGHVEYFMAYSNDMPAIYRDGANPGFHEAIGDTIALSVSTPKHLKILKDQMSNDTKDSEDDKKDTNNIVKREAEVPQDEEKRNLNFLMKQALEKIPLLPFSFLVDEWRWDLFEGKVPDDQFNKAYWRKRMTYQGIKPGVSRLPDGLDAGSKYHVSAGVPYIRYFVAQILEFQFHEKLCSVAKIKDPVYNCDIYGNADAGKALLAMLSKGASEQWQDQLAEFLGTKEGRMDADSIIQYFQPLWDFLDKEISDNNINVGWSSSEDTLNSFMNTSSSISSIVPIVVGIVLAVLVCIVLIAFFVGQSRRKKAEKLQEEAAVNKNMGIVNEAMQMEDKTRV